MNGNHQRRVAVAYRHIDGLLREAEDALAGSGASSPFSLIIPDAAPVQHRVIADYAQHLRGAMARAMPRLGIPFRPPEVPATRLALTNLMAAEISLEEIDPRRLGGYGSLAPEDARALADTNAELLTILGQMGAYLRAGSGARLETRLERLRTSENVAVALREMARLVTEHGLVTLRPSLERLVEEAESGAYEIAVFGRVSSGKSSLLNRILGRNVLPVGVTPVTALVTRISHGPEERVTIHFAAEKAIRATLEVLPAYVTEQGNPSNHKHVASVLIELPGDRLPEGVTFVDTPGLGSLATGGAAETMAYLPRADLGILLADATAGLALEDVRIGEALLQAGAQVRVVLSKADLLSPDERRQVLDYATARMASGLGGGVPVHLVSTLGPDAWLADQWFEAELGPLIGAHRQQRIRALARKTEGLRMRLLDVLRAKAGSRPAPVLPEVEQAFREAEGQAERALEACHDEARRLSVSEEPILQRVVSMLARHRGMEADPALVAGSIEELVHPSHARIVSLLREVRTAMLQALENASSDRSETLDLPSPCGLPIFDGSAVARKIELREPLLGFLHPAWRTKGLLSRIRAQAGPALSEALRFHRRSLEDWTREYLAELSRAFHVQAGPLRVLEGGAVDPSPESLARLEGDIRGLEALVGDAADRVVEAPDA